MRFLVDAQLPPAIARWLTARGHHAEHVFDLKLAEATDAQIWHLAAKTAAVIVSKDEDFAKMANLKPGPRIVWITTGNLSKQGLLDKLASKMADIETALDAGEMLVELR